MNCSVVMRGCEIIAGCDGFFVKHKIFTGWNVFYINTSSHFIQYSFVFRSFFFLYRLKSSKTLKLWNLAIANQLIDRFNREIIREVGRIMIALIAILLLEFFEVLWFTFKRKDERSIAWGILERSFSECCRGVVEIGWFSWALFFAEGHFGSCWSWRRYVSILFHFWGLTQFFTFWHHTRFGTFRY